MATPQSEILRSISNYYSAKIKEYGRSPLGVDWNGKESQFLRFQQLLKIVQVDGEFSIIDVGCGYGALIDYLRSNFRKFKYIGIDISEEMIASATAQYEKDESVRFHVLSNTPTHADYCVASGIFNVRLKHDKNEWWSYLRSTLDHLNEASGMGFSFNCLTKYSDNEKMHDYLYYADPCKLFDWCKRRYSKQVALLHDYGLYEFTILVRK
jgi:cyclopropane fatty-acyl-phospholipid synthase-like methyltransferase